MYSSSTFHDLLNAGKRTLEHVDFPVPTTVVSQYMLAESFIESRSKLQNLLAFAFSFKGPFGGTVALNLVGWARVMSG